MTSAVLRFPCTLTEGQDGGCAMVTNRNEFMGKVLVTQDMTDNK